MITGKEASRRDAIEQALIREVTKYTEQFGEGMPMQILSCKYARSLKEYGGFPEVIYQLETSGKIEVDLALNGRRTVKPKQATTQQSDKAWF